jgi:hypothetical protein
MSIKIAELLAFVETVKEREEQKKLARKKDVEPLPELLLPESLEVPVLERSELDVSKPKRGRKKKSLSPSHS